MGFLFCDIIYAIKLTPCFNWYADSDSAVNLNDDNVPAELNDPEVVLVSVDEQQLSAAMGVPTNDEIEDSGDDDGSKPTEGGDRILRNRKAKIPSDIVKMEVLFEDEDQPEEPVVRKRGRPRKMRSGVTSTGGRSLTGSRFHKLKLCLPVVDYLDGLFCIIHVPKKANPKPNRRPKFLGI